MRLSSMPSFPAEELRAHVYAAWLVNQYQTKDLTQIASDIWITNRGLCEHTDSTKDGLITFGYVLLNELNLRLVYGGSEFPLGQEEVYQIDARRPHSAEEPLIKSTGLFASLIWDLPSGTDLKAFRLEAEERIAEWLKETPTPYSA